MASLIIITGDQKGEFYPLGHRTTVVGRDEALPFQILDEHISRKHLQIRFDKDDNTYHAKDMKSRHGVFINDRKIEADTILQESDIIRLGQTSCLFTWKDFDDRESALSHHKKVGERDRETVPD
ncbi:MAG: FHA domain-containing protein [Planctomycetota bacterium]|jgi:pSer/pThr/pTyr-binding forkhead associated (FHA) protein